MPISSYADRVTGGLEWLVAGLWLGWESAAGSQKVRGSSPLSSSRRCRLRRPVACGARMAEHRYDPKQIEPRWQQVWADERTWEVPTRHRRRAADTSYVLEMLPYPSGEPHIGHLKVYSVGDAVAHFHRRSGRRVLHPMGYDAFGLPAENHAIQTGAIRASRPTTSIASFQRQFREWGISIDWTREFATHEPRYYRWTQWIFLQLFERGLAYQQARRRSTGTRSRRPCSPTSRSSTAAASAAARSSRSASSSSGSSASPTTPTGCSTTSTRSSGPSTSRRCSATGSAAPRAPRSRSAARTLDIDYPVFTTRPDTLFGATFFVMAPEHPDVLRLAEGTEHEEEVREYVNRALTESDEERGDVDKPKTGVPLGRTVTNPVNGEQLPMYVADYVLMEYGTGAIMAVPAHDERDFAFAQAYGLPIRRVIEDRRRTTSCPTRATGRSSTRTRTSTACTTARRCSAIVDWLDREGKGHPSVNYRLRDWLMSRQRYWGCPIPIVYCDECGMVPVPGGPAAGVLPDVEDYAPQGHARRWPRPRTGCNTTCPRCGGPARRETDTMDTFVDSSWYFLRYCDARNDEAAVGSGGRSPVDARRPVHRRRRARDPAPAVCALLHQGAGRPRALPDGMQEPFARLFTQGMITSDGAKMSKSKGNVVSPQAIVDRYGADTARCYILFIGPPDQDADWSDAGAEGMHRFLARLWRAAAEAADELPEPSAARRAQRRLDCACCARRTGRSSKVTTEMAGRFAFNTAIAAVMELYNEVSPARPRRRRAGRGALRAGDGRVAAVPVRAARLGRRL